MASVANTLLKSFGIRTIGLLRIKTHQVDPWTVNHHRFLRRELTSSTTDIDTTASATSANPALKLSETCVKKIAEICTNETYLRVQVDGGGCSGFQYKFELVSELNEDDIKFGPDGRVVIDSISLDYCAGSTLDYQVELIKSGFRMTSNPKAEQGCSCGASFALKL